MRPILYAAALLAASTLSADAKDLVIGMPIDVVTDPHYFFSGNNIQYYRHYLGFLTVLDRNGKVVPSLAERYEAVADGWIFHLRPNVTFTDGSAFNAEDVIASYNRARNYPNAVGTYAGLFSGVKALTALDPLTLKIATDKPYPTLPFALSQIAIIPSAVAASATQADFQTSKANVSVGPFRFDEYKPNQELVVDKNPGFWGSKPTWDKVTFRIITDPAARVAALLAGDVDVINNVPPEFVDRIRTNENFEVESGPSMRNVFIEMDQQNDVSPFITDKAGKPLTKNPLKDKRVREALSLAVNRDGIRDRVMSGLSFPSGQLVARGIVGHSEQIAVPTYDLKKAKQLLADAGYPEGFAVTLHCPNDRYVNDSKICQALGQMFSRIGVETKVVTLPSSAFFPLVNPSTGKGASLFLASWSAAASGEADVLTHVLHSYSAEAKTGTWNMGRYSNPTLDKLIEQFNATMDDKKRADIEQQAMEMAMDDVAVIPLHDQSVVVAVRKGLTYATHSEDAMTATDVKVK